MLTSNIVLQPCSRLVVKDPQSTTLGKKILMEGINQLAEVGYERFTFKKLAGAIGSTEASVYRYFENKHKFLLYIYDWYWAWIAYRLALALTNLPSPQQRLERAIEVLVKTIEEDSDFSFINEVKLHRIIVSEAAKAYLVKEVDEINREGAYLSYKQVVGDIADIIHEINPNYAFPHMLVSTIIEGAHLQRYFLAHLPRLSDARAGTDPVVDFYLDLARKAIVA